MADSVFYMQTTKLSFVLLYPAVLTHISNPAAFALSVVSSAERFVVCLDPLLLVQFSDSCLS